MAKAAFIRFTGKDCERIANAVKTTLDTKLMENKVAIDSLESESLLKIVQLRDSQILKELFDDLVIKSHLMNEDEFWRSYMDSATNIDNQQLELKRHDSREIIPGGISNKPFLLIPR